MQTDMFNKQPRRGDLHEYQERAIAFMKAKQRCILSVGMGLGKTAACLHYLADTMPATALIVAPKRVAETVWKQEAEKWQLFDVADKMVVVSGTPAQRKAALEDETHPYKILGRDNLNDIAPLAEKNGKRKQYRSLYRFDVIIIDELTSFKSVEASRTLMMAEVARNSDHVVGLTGTFLANGAIDVFGQCLACGIFHDERLFYEWRSRYFRDAMAGSGMAWHKWQPIGGIDNVIAPVKSLIFTLDSKDYLRIPEISFFEHPITLSKDERKRYNDLDAFLACDIEGVGVSATENGKFMKLQTLADGFIYNGEDANGEDFWQSCERGKTSSKLEAVAEFCQRCVSENESVLLFYSFRAEAKWIGEMLDREGIEHRDVKDKDGLAKWNDADWCGVLMAHPASAGHGLNLQDGGRILVWSTLTYNYEYYAQANARLARQGQRKAVQIHVFVADKTCEQGKSAALRRKDKEQNEFLKMTKQ